MAIVEVPDPDWYLDHVLVPSGPERRKVGPARQRQAEWDAAVHHLRESAAGTPTQAAVDLAAGQGLVLRRDQARECGLTDAAIRSLVRRRRWSVPRHGVLCPLPPDVPADGPGRAAARATHPHGGAVQIQAAAAALVRPLTLISHESAAAAYGLPLLGVPARPTLSTIERTREAGRADARVHGVGIRLGETTDWFGTAMTTVARTVIDIARNSGVAAGLVAADAALADELTTRFALAVARHHGRYRPGIRSADRVIELASPLAESPLETLVRLCLVNGRLPVPELQQRIETSRGTYRVDLLYRGRRVIIEADGELKYERPADDDGASPLVAEKRRQEALERAGFVVVRVSWSDVMSTPADVVARVSRALLRDRR